MLEIFKMFDYRLLNLFKLHATAVLAWAGPNSWNQFSGLSPTQRQILGFPFSIHRTPLIDAPPVLSWRSQTSGHSKNQPPPAYSTERIRRNTRYSCGTVSSSRQRRSPTEYTICHSWERSRLRIKLQIFSK